MKELRLRLIKKLIDINESVYFERRLYKFFKKEANLVPTTVIDVGANKGQTIDFFLKLNPSCRIYALEPNPTLHNLLLKKYVKYPGVKIFNFGISNFSGKKLFFENVLDYTSSFEILNKDSVYLKRKATVLGVKVDGIVSKQYEVEVLSLTDFIKQEVPECKIDVLKIDTEGHEYYCLEGLFNGNGIPDLQYIQLENHHDDMYSNRIPYSEIQKLLEQNGFEEFRIVKHGLGDFDEVIYKFKSN